MKYPVNGFTLSKNIKWGNKPFIIFIYVGGSHLEPSKNKDIYYLALEHDQTPEQLIWPVEGIHSLIVWGAGPDAGIVKRVYDCIKDAGALTVNVTVSESDYDIKSSRFGTSEDLEEKKMLARAITYEEFN